LIAIIATGGEETLEALFASIITRALSGTPVRIVRTRTDSFADVLALGELREASLIVTLINNLSAGGKGGSSLDSEVDFIRKLRKHTMAIIFVTYGVGDGDFAEKLRQAGADYAEKVPFEVGVFNKVSLLVRNRWIQKPSSRVEFGAHFRD
jgi:hypothetical protein